MKLPLKRRPTLIEGALFLVIILLIIFLFVLPLFISDYSYGENLLFSFKILAKNGDEVRDSKIDMKAIIVENGKDRFYVGSFEVRERQAEYRIDFRYHRLRPPIADLLGPPKTYPHKFLISIEKEGFQKRTLEYSREELMEKYLQEKKENPDTGREIFIFALPAILLETTPQN